MNINELKEFGIQLIGKELLGEFNQWSNAGYKIKAGSKARKLNGKNVFDHTQVIKYERIKYQGNASLPWIDSDGDYYECY